MRRLTGEAHLYPLLCGVQLVDTSVTRRTGG